MRLSTPTAASVIASVMLAMVVLIGNASMPQAARPAWSPDPYGGEWQPNGHDGRWWLA